MSGSDDSVRDARTRRFHRVRNVLAVAPGAVSVTWMIACSLATTLPLVAGFVRDESLIAIYGALAGYFLTVNEPNGTARHRLIVIGVTFVLLVSGFALGNFFARSGSELAYWISLAFATYWVGLMGGEGAELERGVLYGTLELVVGYHARAFNPAAAPAVLGYASIGLVVTVAATEIRGRIYSAQPNVRSSWRRSFRAPLASFVARQTFAVTFVAAVLATAYTVEALRLDRGYWAVVTILLVVKPDRTLSVYRAVQRLVGTAAAVIVTEGLMFVSRTSLAIVGLIAIAAFFVPWAMKRNYWLVCFLVSTIVLLLLDLATVQSGNFLIPILRLRATAIGALFSILGVGLAHVLSPARASTHVPAPAQKGDAV